MTQLGMDFVTPPRSHNTDPGSSHAAEAIPIIRMCSGRDPFTSIILRSGMTEPEPLPERIEQQLRRVR